MKRVRGWGISNPEWLARRCHRISWGSSFWLRVRERREQEQHERAERFFRQNILPRIVEQAQEAPLPGERVRQEKLVH